MNYSDTSLALTQGASGMTLESYNGADNQLWLLNPDGLQGFAGYCFDDATGNVKAADIGGLFGEVVEATTFDELKEYATSDTPYTIVVTKNISVTELNLNGNRYMCSAGRIYVHNNKTIIGSYGANTLFNVQFCTSSNLGTGDNIIIKNFDMQHDSDSNNNDSIVCYFGSGQNIWVDHVTFTGHTNYGYASNGQVDEDKFLACCYDADYCTISDCSFGAHKYGLILGYPADDENSYNNYNNYPRMSILGNKFYDTNTRGPGLMRWGYFHSMNNYVNKFSMAYTVISNCKIFAENCVYENGGNVICDWDQMTYNGMYSETGSEFSNCNRTQQGGDSNSTAQACSWRPDTNYSYVTLSADEAKSYCSTYSGRQTSSSNMRYLRYSQSGIPSAGYNEAPSGPIAKTGTVFNTSNPYTFKNSSGLYFNGSAQDGNETRFILEAAGDDYYKIFTEDKSMCVSVDGGGTNNGAAIKLAAPANNDSELFKFVRNQDGTYLITTKGTTDTSCLGVSGGSSEIGTAVIQWECDGTPSQNWTIAAEGTLFRHLNILDTANLSNWSIDNQAATGDLLYNDRDVIYNTLPEEINGAEMLVTACNSKNTTTDLASFTAGADMTVYVAMDVRVETLPQWLSDYMKTDMTFSNNNNVIFNIYSINVNKGDTVTLGTNGQSTSCVNYTVFAVETQAEIVGDVNNDGEFNVADLVMMQNYVLMKGTLTDWTAGDLCQDGMIDTFDVVAMRKMLVS